MMIFGNTWDAAGVTGQQYALSERDGVQILLHAPEDEGPIFYRCSLCKERFCHWLCDDRVWARLPAVVRNKVICDRCFRALRELARLEAQSKGKKGK